MALHFERSEFDARRDRLLIEMAEKKLDAVLLFAQESMYWLTGYDTFGFCFFQCLVVKADGSMVLLTRSADLRQARQTSTIENIMLWTDRDGANPAIDLRNLLNDLDLLGARIGVEYDTHGLTAYNGRRVDEQLQTFGQIADASGIVGRLRLFKSPAEIAKAEKAASLADDALDAALPLIKQGGDEALILAAMQGAIFAGGGDYPANEFIIGSGADALLCRYKAGRRKLTKNDQLTLEWAGVFHHYHAAMMRTVLTGKVSKRHQELFDAARAALLAVEKAMTPGNTFGDVFDAHARTLEAHNLTKHRLNACGYSLGARFTPSWMDMPMFYQGNPEPIAPSMTLFAHMIIMDSETETAMTLGRTYLTTESAPKPLSRHDLDLIVQ
ncbi:aminopeptidase P family protein [Mesorhizobium sp. M1C.F.Ca.ET.193.01.1.1]|uniref:M24 family metallopeptidase n=1 Tax=unclassified Mesorhizobium TaxID=325217 RepID=UPI000FD21091|nr:MULTISPECIES: Xaa-Pro peptidase family protein [unclassified Mesorhizobium]TGT02119.1 aminopeptidase P family protein [bacterium M00.F.Ca.ET.177.01.1.1]TGQ54371.1 aminopeptidase P family protein [Mesorhizobium sp. M1C.F.Ca.ET.210.01.1.1]TGQ72367.1 aminopeptidase P family protein [Mesorhizobium sp. M1C.F.Ca.ET.212.01.1.1]TGR10163.1 aminopeptidase P family protein [Mesorhizobium sp. M1C.F.Ca.ET.204.01.1.1]TGR30766.1 aminopeptidase P family protein [Mesorhizobium sp. M1C.F.Ca.ET.196.01.1.1]